MPIRLGRQSPANRRPNALPLTEYWNQCADSFDALYTSEWNQLEDRRVSGHLASLNLPPNPSVLDLGCGTGLGLRLLSAANIGCHYHGVDISPRMIEKFKAEDSIAKTISVTVADMATYDWPDDRPLNLVMSVFSSMSFSRQRWEVLSRISERQKSGDKIYLMSLSRFSLYRLIRGKFSEEGTCRTRGSSSREVVRAYFETPRRMRRNLESVGYKVESIIGDGPMSGLWEAPVFWRANDYLGRAWPTVSYTIIAIGEKVSDANADR